MTDITEIEISTVEIYSTISFMEHGDTFLIWTLPENFS